jgi:hypothetical protein
LRSLTPIEAAIAFALCGCVLAVAIPEFVRGLHASRLAEPVDGLRRIATSAVSLASASAAEPTFPASVALTPPEVARGVRSEDPPGVWDQATWRTLGFGFDHPHAFSFAFESSQGPSRAHFRAIAHGDLDGDGVLSTFEIEGDADADGARIVPGMYVDREVE